MLKMKMDVLRCANNCDGCYQVTKDNDGNDIGYVCKDYVGTDETRVCTADYQCQP